MTRVLTAKGEQKDALADFIPAIPRSRAYPSAVQSIPNAAATAVVLDQETFDTDGMHDLVTNNSRLTIKTAGVYLVHGKISWAAPGAASTAVYTQLRKNGTLVGMQGGEISNIGNQGIEAVGVFECAVGDYFEVWGDQRSGGALNTGPSDQLTYLEAIYIGPGFNTVRAKPTIQYVTPAQFGALAPIDGDEVYFVADAANGVIWHLRYNAASASAYKWEYLGGPPLISRIDTEETLTAGRYADLATPGPSVVVPRGGDYDITYGANVGQATASNVGVYTSPRIGATAPTDADSAVMDQPVTNFRSWVGRERIRKTGLAAADTIKVQYGEAGGTADWQRRSLSVWPVRIS